MKALLLQSELPAGEDEDAPYDMAMLIQYWYGELSTVEFVHRLQKV